MRGTSRSSRLEVLVLLKPVILRKLCSTSILSILFYTKKNYFRGTTILKMAGKLGKNSMSISKGHFSPLSFLAHNIFDRAGGRESSDFFLVILI